MSISIPAKTFLLGEYAALQGYPGIVLNTHPGFELSLVNLSENDAPFQGIHPASPAALFWLGHGIKGKGLKFYDPYAGLGGLGASSAQFLGAYLFAFGISKQEDVDLSHLLKTYETFTWHGQGPKPSGYDVLAQLYTSCVYVSKSPLQVLPLAWSMPEVNFVLAHTGVKCVTHTHLHQLQVSADLHNLGDLVIKAKDAIENTQVGRLSEIINEYDRQLRQHGWVTNTTQVLVDRLKTCSGVLAAKGCGAMGSDVIFILVEKPAYESCVARLSEWGLNIIASGDCIW